MLTKCNCCDVFMVKLGALNKVGHGLHLIPGAFRDYTTSDKIRNLVKELGWVDPKGTCTSSLYLSRERKIKLYPFIRI